MNKRPLIGISSCLLGEKVRYDGRDKRDDVLTKRLGPLVEWVPVCPEFEAGMGVPRERIRLVQSGDNLRLVGEASGRDWTHEMQAWAGERVAQLMKMGLSGYILKKNSPSCGLQEVPVYAGEAAESQPRGRGMFARVLMEQAGKLPVEEEDRLHEPAVMEDFIKRIFARRR